MLTHFHTDHAGGLAHFPRTEIVATRTDYANSQGLRGSVRGFLPQRWPKWFGPTLIEHEDGPFESFDQSTTLTHAGDVHLIPTPGHTPGHMSVALEDGDELIVFAGDASYTEQNMLDGVADGVSPSMKAARDSLARLRRLAVARPTVYLPTHDPGSGARLAARQIVGAS